MKKENEIDLTEIKDLNYVSEIKNIYNYLSNTLAYKDSISIYEKQKVILKNVDIVEDIEKDGKSYPIAVIYLYCEDIVSSCWQKVCLEISPYYCYLYKGLDRRSLKNSIVDTKITKEYRNYMLAKFGNAYREKCIQFINNASNIRLEKAKEDYQIIVDRINKNQADEMNGLIK